MGSAVKQLQTKYFQIIEEYFGPIYGQMKKKDRSLRALLAEASSFLDDYDDVLAANTCEMFLDDLTGLDWNSAFQEVRRQGGVKALIESPLYTLNRQPITRLSLYADTTVVSTPIIPGFREMYRELSPKTGLSQILGTSLLLLTIKELFLADVDPPIAVIIPPAIALDNELRKAYTKIRDRNRMDVASTVFGKQFQSQSELDEFVTSQKTLANLCQQANTSELFANAQSFAKKQEYPLKEKIERQMKLLYFDTSRRYDGFSDSRLLIDAFHEATGEIGKEISQLITCGRLAAQPCADNSQSWRRLIWEFDRDNELLAKKLRIPDASKDALVLNALQLDGFEWLGNIPVPMLVQLREEGDLQELRDVLSKGVEKMEAVEDEDFLAVSGQVKYNLTQEFKRHRQELQQLKHEFGQRYKFDIASIAVSGSIGLASAMFPPIALVSGMIGGTGALKFLSDVMQESFKREELGRKPVAMLFETYGDN